MLRDMSVGAAPGGGGGGGRGGMGSLGGDDGAGAGGALGVAVGLSREGTLLLSPRRSLPL